MWFMRRLFQEPQQFQGSIGFGPGIVIGQCCRLEKTQVTQSLARDTRRTSCSSIFMFPIVDASHAAQAMQYVNHMHDARDQDASDVGKRLETGRFECGTPALHCKRVEADRRNTGKVHLRVDRHALSESN